ncbi:nuclear pore complex protein NUP50B-like [Tasmannia lanceolata]|uniref:nuclear pore complex protein NUP50B-like n=1 Tax=Tasmannia lanceolata TaxID=3420 RepID=UPI004063802F
MGDAENALPPSKKRVAGRELSRDNPGLDDENDAPDQETGTFQRATDEVLASRRIVKVCRPQPSSTASNPFAGICLVPQTNSSEVKTTNATVHHQSDKGVSEEVDGAIIQGKTRDEETEKGAVTNEPHGADESNMQLKDKPDGLVTETADKEAKDSVEEASKHEESNKKEGGGEATENEVKEANGQENRPMSSFQQLSSSQNAFTGLAGTGFSSSSFSFGLIPKEGSPFGGSSGSRFALKNKNTSFPSFGIGDSNNGIGSSTSNVTKTDGIVQPSMQEVPVETGEENEKAVFTNDAVLFEYIKGGWKERGKGELKVNVSTTGSERARLVMRARGNYRLILNASLYPDMKLTSMEKRGITFACMNSASEVKDGLVTFALKFKDAFVVDEFRGAVTAHKGKKTTVLNTPENSPKTSDD